MSGTRSASLLGVGLALVWLLLVWRVGPPTGDFANYHVSASLWLEGADLSRLYDYRWFGEQATRLGWADKPVGFPVLTPPSVLFAVPLAPLGLYGAALAWQLVQAAMGLGLALALARGAGRPLWTGLALVLAFWPSWRSHLEQGQFHLPAVLLVALGYPLLHRGRPIAAGACWGLAAGLKLFAWPLLPLLLLGRQWRASAAFVGVLALGGAASLALLGLELNLRWVEEIAPAASRGMFMHPWTVYFQGLGTGLRAAFVAHPGLNPGLVESGTWGAALARGLPAALPVLAVGAVLAAGWRWSEAPVEVQARLLGAASVAAFVTSPALSRYHILTLIPAVYWVAAATPGRPGWRALAPAAAALAVCHVPLPDGWPDTARWLLGVPRAWLALLCLVLLIPWRRASGLALLAVLLLGGAIGVRASSPPPVRDPARPLDHPAFPMTASELRLTPDGTLWFSGLGRRTDPPGQGWVVYRWDPSQPAPEVVAADLRDHRWAPEVDGQTVSWSGGSGAWSAPAPVPCAGGTLQARLDERQSDIAFERNGQTVWLTRDPAWDEEPVCDEARGRVWFLSDRGAGVRALRLWWVPLPASAVGQ